MSGLPILVVAVILLAAVLAPAMGMSLMNNSNSSSNFNESLNNTTNPVHDSKTPCLSPSIEAALPIGSPDEPPVVATPRTYGNTTLEEKTVFERNDSMFINVSISDVNGASDLNTILITILNANSDTILDNDIMTQDTPVTSGYVYNYFWMVPDDADSGTWTIEVYANDTLGNMGSASVRFIVNITNATVPENKNVTVDLIATKEHFVLNENPEFTFIVNYNTTGGESKANKTGLKAPALGEPKPNMKPFSVNAFSKRVGLKTLATPTETISTSVYYKDELLDIEPEIEKIGEGDFSIKIPSKRAFRAGLYKLKVELAKDNVTYVEEQEFEWGLVSLNTRKSIYKPGETGKFIIVVLDKAGHPVCDTDVSLVVTNPNNEKAVYSTADGTILPCNECGIYTADYPTEVEGNHIIDITALIDGTEVDFSTYFLVQQDYEFDIIRTAKSKIDPVKRDWFDVAINVESFAGANVNSITIKEFVPAEFDLNTDADIIEAGDTKVLTWNKNLTGNKASVSYSYSVPHIWPYLYALGPAEIGYGSERFTEARAWYVAVDPETIFHETFPNSTGTGGWDGSAQDKPGWVTIQGDGDPNDIQINAEDINAGTLPPSGGNNLNFEDCDHGFHTPEDFDIAYVSVDLSGYSGVEISYYWQDGGCGSTEGMRSAYSTDSTDGKDGTWTLMYEHVDEADDVWVKDTYSLPDAACVATFKLRFSAKMSASKEHIYIDDVMVTGSLPDTTSPWWSSPETDPVIIYENDVVAFFTDWNDNVALSGYIFSTNHSGTWVNESFTSFGCTPDTAEQEMTITASAGTTVGWRFYANDTSDNWNVTDVQTFVVQDGTPPEWSSPETDPKTVKEDDVVTFFTDWNDNVALSGYIFSTNHSGAWVNSSFVSFSGTFNISENVTQITASAGTTVGWRFYANDTSNNWNVTANQSFVVQSAEVITPVTTFMICGRVFYEDGSECNNSLVVNITNLNNSKQWSAKTNASYNYYQLILANGTDLNATEVLQFNVSDGFRYNVTNHTVTQENITDGGLFNFNFTLPTPPSPSTPYVICGRVFYKNGTACNNPTVNLTNMNNSRQWQAETNASYNYYQIALAGGTDLNATEILQFNVKAPDASQFNTTSHTVTQDKIDGGGLFNFNLTLKAPETPFIIYGRVNYDNGTACDDPTVNITNTNTSITWQAETHSGYNYYQLVLDTTNISTGNVLSFNATDGTEFNVTNYTVTQENMADGGLFDFNLTLLSGSQTEGPTVDSITITPDDSGEAGVQINPTPGGNTTVNISAVVSDPEGWDDVDTVNATITGPGTVSDSPVTLSFVSNSSLMTATYNGTFNMSFYYANGTYTVDVTATDNGSLTGSNSTTFNYTTAIALELDTGTVNFSSSGPIDPGEMNEVLGDEDMSTLNNATVRNIGNVVIDMNVSGTDMTSAGNVVTKDNIEARINETNYQNMSMSRCFDVDMSIGFSSLENADFTLFVPYGTQQGDYSGTITLTAKPS